MDSSWYNECQMRLGAISDDFYLNALTIIKDLDGKDRLVAEQLVDLLKCSLAEICTILSLTMQG